MLNFSVKSIIFIYMYVYPIVYTVFNAVTSEVTVIKLQNNQE